MENKLDVIQFLLDEIKQYEPMLKAYKEDFKQATEKAKQFRKDNPNTNCHSAYHYHYMTTQEPKKQLVLDNCKIIRRLLLEISKETI